MRYEAVMRVATEREHQFGEANVGYHHYQIPVKPGEVSGSVGRSHISVEVSVMDMEQRALVIWSYYFKQPL